jgi:hypothetical protein
MEKGVIVLPWDNFLHVGDELTAGAFTGAAKVPVVHVRVKHI